MLFQVVEVCNRLIRGAHLKVVGACGGEPVVDQVGGAKLGRGGGGGGMQRGRGKRGGEGIGIQTEEA